MKLPEMVKQGYQSLGTRALGVFDEVRPGLEFSSNEISSLLNDYRTLIFNIYSTGIPSFSSESDDLIQAMLSTWNQCVPEQILPTDHGMSLNQAIACHAITQGVSLEVFLEKSKIVRYIGVERGAALGAEFNNGALEMIFQVAYDKFAPAYSVVENVHALYGLIQPETEAVFKIAENAKQIEGYADLCKIIITDPILHEKSTQREMGTNFLRFFRSPEMFDLANDIGMEMDTWKDFLDAAVPKLDALLCYTSGQAFYEQTRVLMANPLLSIESNAKKIYEMLSLTDAISNITTDVDTTYSVGIGLYEYFKNNPAQASLKDSPDFAQELSLVFFDKN